MKKKSKPAGRKKTKSKRKATPVKKKTKEKKAAVHAASSSKKKKTKVEACVFDWNVSEAELTIGMEEELRDAWEKLRAFASDLGPQRIYASPQAIMFSKKVCYFYVRPKKKHIEVWIFLPRKVDGLKSIPVATTKVKFSNMFKLVHEDEVEEPLTEWIREAFHFAPAQNESVPS